VTRARTPKTQPLTLGSLCTGYGGLDLAVEHIFGAELAWYAETDPAASRVLAARFPGKENLGDISQVDWSSVAKVDIVAAGFPCQDISNAGRREGITGSRSGLWTAVAGCVRQVGPALVVVEFSGRLDVRIASELRLNVAYMSAMGVQS
jgi:DNA (cytosine-5)-methyltransferase 1